MHIHDPFILDGHHLSFFDLVYILISVSMFVQAVVFLHFARENLITFLEEHANQKLSKTLDQKNRGHEIKK